MAASDYVPIFFKNRLRLAGRPQMSTILDHVAVRLGLRRDSHHKHDLSL